MAPRSLPPTKKRKIEHDSELAERIKLVESNLLDAVSKNESLNPLADLLEICLVTKEAKYTSKSIYAAYRVFVVLINSGKLGIGGDEAAKLVKTWILGQLNTFVGFLAGLLKDEEKTLRVSYRVRGSFPPNG
jgi:U3 small nucleolar RNA-associated protein 19